MRTPTSKPHPYAVLALVCAAQFMIILDVTIVNVALPSIASGLQFAPADLQWVVNAYTLVFGGLLLLGGRAADLLGRQRLFIAGTTLFTVASALNAVATSPGVLVGGRALQGLGAALVTPAALAIVTTTFAAGRDRTRALAVWSAIAAGGGAIGLLLGGVLTDLLSWRWVFFINLPVGIAAALLALPLIRNTKAERRPEAIDAAGATTVTVGLLLLVLAIVKAPDWGFGSARTIGLAAAAGALLAAFVAIELRSRDPLVRLGILRNRALTVANVAMLLVYGGLFGMFYFVSLYLQGIEHYSPMKAGVAFVPITLVLVLGAAVAQALHGPAALLCGLGLGLGLCAVGLTLVSGLPTEASYARDILPGLVVMGVGVGFCFTPLTVLATTTAGDEAGLASGLFNTFQQIGGALGLAILSTVAASTTDNALAGAADVPAGLRTGAVIDGYERALLVAVAFALAALALVALGVRRSHVGAGTPEPALAATDP